MRASLCPRIPCRFARFRKVRSAFLAIAVCLFLYSLRFCYVVLYDTPNVKLSPIPTLLIEPKLQEREIFLLILVTTTPWRWDSLDRRDAIRTTWARSSKTSSLSPSVVVFNIGRTYSQSFDEKIENEASQHGDILVGDYKDTYANIIIKVFFAFDWALRKLNCKFVVKADDDVYLRLPKLVKWLQSQEMPERLYAGPLAVNTGVVRFPWHRHFVSYKTYNYSYWKTYTYGFVYVISVALIPELREAVKFHQLFPIDDSYFGLLMETIQVKPRNLPNCPRKLNSDHKLHACDDCVYHNSMCVGNPLSVTQMRYVHVRVTAADAMDGSSLEAKCTDKDWGDPWEGECKSHP